MVGLDDLRGLFLSNPDDSMILYVTLFCSTAAGWGAFPHDFPKGQQKLTWPMPER